MQQPVGYVLRNGRPEMTDFLALLLNPNLGVQFPHTCLAGLTTAAFFVMGISAYHLLRKHEVDLFRRSFQIAAVIGAICHRPGGAQRAQPGAAPGGDPADEDGLGRSAVARPKTRPPSRS